MPINKASICLLLTALQVTAVFAAPLRVGVSVLPLETLVKQIGGTAVEVQSLQREGDSCSVFEPRPSAITWLSGAQLFFRIGAGYETVIMDKLDQQFPKLAVRDLREAVPVLPLEQHDHDHEGHDCTLHGGEATDPHIWLDPVRLAAMAVWIADELSAVLPESRQAFQREAADLSGQLMQIHADLGRMFAGHHGKSFYVYHPALGYFADRYGLNQVTIAATGQGPSPKELHQLIQTARAAQVRVILVQPQESRKHARIVADAIDAELVEIDPMSTQLEENLLRIGSVLIRAIDRD